MITLIDRNLVPLEGGILSGETLISLEQALAHSGKILIYLNRRGAYRAFVCGDCSHTWKCPNCDVAMTLHTSPKTQLVCHHCHTILPVPTACPQCHGQNIK